MSTVQTDKTINTQQLAQELGGVTLSTRSIDGLTHVTADVDQATLLSAIDAHVPIDYEANRSRIETRLFQDIQTLATTRDALTAIVDKTNAEIGPKDTKDVARELRYITVVLGRLTRHILNDFSTDE